jgi:hypothetical protein
MEGTLATSGRHSSPPSRGSSCSTSPTLLTGDEANQAAADRGKETPVPNDYFIVNDNPRLRELPVAPGLRILLLDWTDCCDTMFRADPQLFQESFDQQKYPPGNYKGRFSGYWVTVRGGAVTKVEEQYFP